MIIHLSRRKLIRKQHWHGASPEKAMSHIAIHEDVNGQVVEWMEKVSEQQYSR